MSENEMKQGRREANLIKTTVRLYLWILAWVLSIFLLIFGSHHIWNLNTSINVLMIVVNVAIGAGMILAQVRHLKVTDEMEQRVMLETSALTLGLTLVFAGSFQLWEDIKLISFEPQIWHVISAMGLIHIVVTLTAALRHR